MSQDPTQQAPSSGGVFRGIGNFFGEFLKPDTDYNTSSPLGEQVYNRALRDTSLGAMGSIRQAQIEAGTQNLLKILPSGPNAEATARKIAELMNSPAAQQGFAAIKGQVINMLQSAGLAPEQAVAYANSFEKNFRGLFSGFNGDYLGVFNTATAGTHDRRAIEQIGLMATRMQSITPSAENKYARAEDYQGALAGLMREGFRAEQHIIRYDEDMYRQATRLTDVERDRFQDEMQFSEVKRSNERWADLQKNEAQLKKTMDTIRASDFYKQNAKRLEGKSDQDIYSAFEKQRIDQDVDTVMSAIRGQTPEDVEQNISKILKTGTEDQKRLVRNLKNQFGAAQLQRIADDQVAMEQDFRNVLATVKDSTGFMQRLPGDDYAKRQQLIRMLGGTTMSNDRKEQAERAMTTLAYASAGGIDVERAVSMVSEAGKITQSLGLRGDAAQVAGSLAALMTASANNQYRALGDRVDPSKLEAINTRNAASIIASDSSRNLTFLMTGTFKEGSRMQRLQNLLNSGAQLSKRDLAMINVENLRTDYAGTAENFEANMSQSAIDTQRDMLDPNQTLALYSNAAAIETNKFLEYVSGAGAEDAYTRTISRAEYRGDLHKLFQTRVKLLDKVGPKRASELLAGIGSPLTEEERKILGPDLLAEIAAVEKNVVNRDRFLRKEKVASANWAKYSGYMLGHEISIEEMHTLPSVNEQTYAQAVREKTLAQELPTDFDKNLFEAFVNGPEDLSIRSAKLLKGLLGSGVSTQAEARRELLRNNKGVKALVTGALHGAKDAKTFIYNLTGIDDKEEQEEWVREMGFNSADAMFSGLRTAVGKKYDLYIDRIAQWHEDDLLKSVIDEYPKHKKKKEETAKDSEKPSTDNSTEQGTSSENKGSSDAQESAPNFIDSLMSAVQPLVDWWKQIVIENGAVPVLLRNPNEPQIKTAEGKQQ